MKKVAVCISGQFRSFDKCLPSIFTNLILTNSNYELKFFTSFAKEENKPINIPADFFNISTVIKIEEDSVLPDLTYQKLKYKYKDFNLDSETDPKLIYYQLKQFQSVFNLVKEYEINNNMTFDYVVRLRPDLEVKNIFDWKLSDNEIITPLYDSFGGYNDRFAVGPRDLMETYMNRITYWMSENDEESYTTQNEVNLKNYLDSKNISVRKIPIDLQYIRYNDFSKTKIKITNITKDEVHFSNVTNEPLPLTLKICCGKEVIFLNKSEVPPNVGWFAGSPNKCQDKKVIFQGNDLYLEYKMN
jgi:hypothetical protein